MRTLSSKRAYSFSIKILAFTALSSLEHSIKNYIIKKRNRGIPRFFCLTYGSAYVSNEFTPLTRTRMKKTLLIVFGIFICSFASAQIGFEESRTKMEIKNVSPNPVEGELTVQIAEHENIENLEIKIFNIIGHELVSLEVEKKALIMVPFTELPSGPYILSLYNMGSLVDSRRILKK